MAKSKALFSINLGENGGRKVFYSFPKILHWINQEISYWEWVLSYSSRANVRAFYNSHNAELNRLNKLINRVEQQNPTLDSDINLIKSEIEKIFRFQKLAISSNSVNAKYIETIKSKNPQKAAYVYSYFLGNKSTDPDFLFSSIEALLFQKGITEYGEENIKAINDLVNEIDKNLEHTDKLKNEAQAVSQELVGLNNSAKTKFDKQFLEQETKTLNLINRIQEEKDALIESASIRIDSLEEIYDKKLALQSSVAYWQEKVDYHKSFLSKFYIFFTFSIIASISIFYAQIRVLFGDYTLETPPPYWIAAIVVLTISALIWFIRILAKIMLSNIHLQADARERKVMIQTYLALLRRENAITENDRKAILQTLFRPSATGIIKDDNLPNFFWDKLTNN